jgi:hypothetical protein
MRVYFTNKSLHQKLVDVDDYLYAFLSKFQCSAFKKNIYLADDGYYEIKEDHIYRHHLDFNKSLEIPKLNSPELVVSMASWVKSEVSVLPVNSIKVGIIVEVFKLSDTISFVIERNDEASTDYFFDIKGKTIKEADIISFLSEITNVCVN